MSPVTLTQERFGGQELWSTDPDVSRPVTPQLEAAAAELAQRGGGLLHRWVTAPAPADHEDAVAAGFEPYRRLFRMERPLPLTDEPYALGWRPFRPGVDEEEWLAVNAASFANHPIQGTMIAEDLAKAQHEPWFDPDGFVIAADGERMSGFCWTKVHGDEDPPVGEIYVIGAHPDFQGRGLGRALVLAGLDHLAGQGLTVGMLFVEADNEPAVNLYHRLGFEIIHEFRGWRRVVAPA